MLVGSGSGCYKMGPGPPRKETMMRRLLLTSAVLPLLAFPGLAPADNSLGIRAGTLGGGLELAFALTHRAAVRPNPDAYNSKQPRAKHHIDNATHIKLPPTPSPRHRFP